MATKMYVYNTGTDETLEELARLGRDVDLVAGESLMAAARVYEEGMRQRVPKDTHNLEKHIQIKGPQKDGNYYFVEVGVIDDRGFTDAETARYGAAQEYGTSTMAAQSYIRATVDHDTRKARKAASDVLKASL
jgi:HK97 gp10 family phage protein